MLLFHEQPKAKVRVFVDCNKQAEKLTGYSKAEIVSMSADKLHPKDVVERIEIALSRD